jgi:hypothetical protein
VQNGGKNAEDVGLLNFRDPECGERVPGWLKLVSVADTGDLRRVPLSEVVVALNITWGKKKKE